MTEEDAVRAVLEADLASYMARDKHAWEQHWVQEDRFHSIMECGTMQIAKGYTAFRQNVFAAMDADPDPIEADIRLENMQIDMRGDLAWATFEEVVTDTSNPQAAPNLSHNFRLLERQDGCWRILFHGCWAEPLRDIETPAVEVSETCEVLWMNMSAAACLKTFAGLTVSHGTLRAASRTWDKALRDTVARSHGLTGFGVFNQAASEGGGQVTFPVVLGEDDDGALLICRVRVADGRVYVLFGDDPDLTTQLDVARVIFGLSETQTEIVRLIAQGHDLAAIAGQLGITKNTARTHLRRVFEKVGVSSQIELLRRLVSFSV